MVVEFSYEGGGSSIGAGARRTVNFDDGTGNERHVIYNASGNVSALTTDGGAPQALPSVAVTPAAGSLVRVAYTWKADSCQVSVNGTAGTRDETATMPTVDRIGLGARTDAGGAELFGVIRRIWIYADHHPTDAPLNGLTA
jgi:hypothetical protein